MAKGRTCAAPSPHRMQRSARLSLGFARSYPPIPPAPFPLGVKGECALRLRTPLRQTPHTRQQIHEDPAPPSPPTLRSARLSLGFASRSAFRSFLASNLRSTLAPSAPSLRLRVDIARMSARRQGNLTWAQMSTTKNAPSYRARGRHRATRRRDWGREARSASDTTNVSGHEERRASLESPQHAAQRGVAPTCTWSPPRWTPAGLRRRNDPSTTMPHTRLALHG